MWAEAPGKFPWSPEGRLQPEKGADPPGNDNRHHYWLALCAEGWYWLTLSLVIRALPVSTKAGKGEWKSTL